MKTSYGLEYELLSPEHLNNFVGYDRSIAEIQIANCGHIIVSKQFGDVIDNEYDLAEIYEKLKEENEMK